MEYNNSGKCIKCSSDYYLHNPSAGDQLCVTKNYKPDQTKSDTNCGVYNDDVTCKDCAEGFHFETKDDNS